MIRDALNDVSSGVNVKIAALSLDGTDTRPGNVTVWCQADRNVFVRERDLANGSIIVIEIAEPSHTTLTGMVIPGGRRDWEIPVRVGYVTRNPDDSVNARNTWYVLRAALQSITDGLLSPAQLHVRGDRNGIAIKTCSQIVMGETKEEAWGAVMTGALLFTLIVTDKNPT